MSVFSRLGRAIEWRWRDLRRWTFAQLRRRLPIPWVVRLRWPGRKPWEQPALRIASHGGGIGDELMALAVIGELHRRHPACEITFVSRFPDLFAGLPGLAAVVPQTPEAMKSALVLTYESKGRGTLAAQLGESIGLVLPPVVPPLPALQPSAELAAQIAALPRPRVIIQPRASRWTPVKNWPLPAWISLVRQLTARFTVIEVGTDPVFAGENFGPNFVSFAGRTSLTDFLWLVGQGQVFVGPSSGGMHVAAAHGLPLMVVFGGYEHPSGYDYPRTTAFYRAVPCAPCWLTTECPVGLQCMHQIAPEEVFAAVARELEAKAP